ncbi:MAG: 3-dehydroquinate synthase [Clostridia bacterium]|nr:3-dehydroquinate synthase [Clostridia bacterium]
MTIHIALGKESYDVTVERGALSRAGEIFDLDRRALVVTDDGVPKQYAEAVAARCKEAHIVTVKAGEGSKSAETYLDLLDRMVEAGFERTDCVVAVGGGVVGDLAGFVAASYMRGVDFYNVPTTLLSMVDSSIGGKTAINFGGIKNIVGAFWQPKAVLIDPDVLKTLPARQISNGLAEAIKMAATFDRDLFGLIERGNAAENIEKIIVGSLDIKRRVVEADSREAGLRRVLNFGHTIGHGIEAERRGALYHGECVALGMLPMCSSGVRARLSAVLEKNGLPTLFNGDRNAVVEALTHDKKASGGMITVVTVDEIGEFAMIKETPSELLGRMTAVWGE